MKTYTIKDTGETIEIKKVSPMLIQQLYIDFPAPNPPVQEVDYGNGKLVKEPNPAHPEYLAQLREHEQKLQEKLQRLMLKLGTKFEMTPERKQEVDELRKLYLEEFDKELSDDDRWVWLYYIAIGSGDDFSELMSAIYSRNEVTEEGLKAAEQSFQG